MPKSIPVDVSNSAVVNDSCVSTNDDSTTCVLVPDHKILPNVSVIAVDVIKIAIIDGLTRPTSNFSKIDVLNMCTEFAKKLRFVTYITNTDVIATSFIDLRTHHEVFIFFSK